MRLEPEAPGNTLSLLDSCLQGYLPRAGQQVWGTVTGLFHDPGLQGGRPAQLPPSQNLSLLLSWRTEFKLMCVCD